MDQMTNAAVPLVLLSYSTMDWYPDGDFYEGNSISTPFIHRTSFDVSFQLNGTSVPGGGQVGQEDTRAGIGRRSDEDRTTESSEQNREDEMLSSTIGPAKRERLVGCGRLIALQPSTFVVKQACVCANVLYMFIRSSPRVH